MSLPASPSDRTAAALLRFGVINLDKPPGPSAHQVTGWIRDAIDDALETPQRGSAQPNEVPGDFKAAHGGTLDPKVTGCLPILIGRGTRAARVFDDVPKEYVAVLELHSPLPSQSKLAKTLETFEGELFQRPPRKSAVARRRRTRTIRELKALSITERRVLLSIHCEAGTYVRKLCHHFGLALGTGGHMGALRRTSTGSFDDTDLVKMEDVVDALACWQETGIAESLASVVEPAERALSHLPSVTIAESAAREVANGAPVYAPGVLSADRGPPENREEPPLVACYTPNGAAICLGRLVGHPGNKSGIVVDLQRVLI